VLALLVVLRHGELLVAQDRLPLLPADGVVEGGRQLLLVVQSELESF
jgi:hypothetical protein